MINERKVAEKSLPETGELVQGILFSMLTAIDHFESAEALFEINKRGNAYSLLINGLEEIGRINKLSDLLVGWDKNSKVKEYFSKQKDHILKLESAFGIFSSILNLESTELKINNILSYDGSESAIEFVLKNISKDKAKKYHNLKQNLMYTNFDKQIFSSPYHHLKNIDDETSKLVSSFLKEVFKKLFYVGKSLFPVIFEIVGECYYCEDAKQISNLKKEINRRVKRLMPSIRQVINELVRIECNLSLDDLSKLPKNERPVKLSIEAKELIEKISVLVKGHDKIETINYYPPLKDSAKKYYSQFTNN